jgi:hypothetical protein
MSDQPSETAEAMGEIGQIIALNERIRSFWQGRGRGWAPRKAATLLERARLDRLVSLSHTLQLWTEPCPDAEDEGRLVLAWANLGILVEGAMTWFLCVWEDAYARNPMQSRRGFDLDPNRLNFEEMTRFYRQHVWVDGEREGWDGWLTKVRERRNAVHAFNHRELGTWDEFWQAVVQYREFIEELDSRVPYPDASDYA